MPMTAKELSKNTLAHIYSLSYVVHQVVLIAGFLIVCF